MSTILESVNTLSEKLGVTEREQTIKDQLDLCVERLGGEGNSKDIAESAEKFAEKEDGTATFMTKTITENNTYNAADDGVSGYSSVTVEVPSSGGEAFEVEISWVNDAWAVNKTYADTLEHIENGDFVKFLYVDGAQSILVPGYCLYNGTDGKYILIVIQTAYVTSPALVAIKWLSDGTLTDAEFDEVHQ